MMTSEGVMIYDIETNSVDPHKAIPRIIGWWSTITNEYYWTTDLEVFQRAVDEHKFICGWNQINYDNVVLQRFGISFKYKIQLDLMNIINGSGWGTDKGRKGLMIAPDGKTQLGTILHSKKLSDCAKALGGTMKQDFEDYDMFKVPFHTLSEEKQGIGLEYLEHDVLATRDIYLYCEAAFAEFRDGGLEIDGTFRSFLTDEEKRKKKYITMSVGSLVYHAFCNMAGVPCKFGEKVENNYEGGFVRDPIVEAEEYDIYCLDYTSAYPFAYMMFNLFGRVPEGEGFKGERVCFTEGTYDDKNYNIMTKILRGMFDKRKVLKNAGDGREYTYKIFINTSYGATGNPSFLQLFDEVAAADCTRLVRQWIIYASTLMAERGYTVLYGDTDSIYVQDPFKNKTKMMSVVKEHIDTIKSLSPFPQDDFDMSIDDEIDYMFFIKRDTNKDEFIKKNYYYVTKDTGHGAKVKIKGHAIGNSKGSALTKHIFNKYIKAELLNNTRDKGLKRHKWTRPEIEKWVEHELKQDLGLVAKFFKVKKAEEYASKTSLHYQFATSALYGEGSHHMIKLRVPHTKGAGRNSNYIGIEHKDTITINMIELSSVWNELAPFIQNEQKGLDSFF